MIRIFILIMCLLNLSLVACTRKKSEIGTSENPVKFFFVPSVDVKVIEDTSKVLEKYLEANTPYKYKILIPPSYIAVVEAFGTKRADVAVINTFGYLLAHDRYGARAALTTIRHGESTYKAQFLARADSEIKKLEDLEGKKVAFVDPASTSGYLLPLKFLKDRKIKPKETMFAMRHDNVVSMIYQGQVDAGATFYSPPADGQIQDARRLVKAQYPDVEEKVVIIELTSPIPNDPVIFRKDLPDEMVNKITSSLRNFAGTAEGKETLQKLSSVTGLAPSTDKDYDQTRQILRDLGKSASELVK
ncbi:MAG: phosphate/phosphite/phosphonate ABC transporter substrate-binding protein [Bdellovibrionales bacterium]|nr:phosphate/phosphite/phosphonate ABC transporter substrate-binding protein [Bdellovibrionales bacterium]